ncbi:HGWP repeat containing protein-like [Oryza sativa Japonica Group]|uniref:cysteine dioxygenase n=1 Tax=Oryza sativa subsp. japonica TaxID=39947 RepID=Q5JJX2_ORYSJ|nr:HGWP repeat containing protein-like [Oryza sativa Japonica Group]
MALSLSLTLQEWISQNITTGSPRPPPTGVSACTAGLLCRRCWASTSSPTGLPSPPPTDVLACTAGLYAAVVGRLRLHRPACLRHRRPMSSPARLAFMPPLLGVYVFTDRLAFAAADWCFRLHGWPLCCRCWASTSSPTGRLVGRRLVFPPARLAYYATVVGRLRLHRPAASSAADWCLRLYGWCLRLHGWPIIPPLLGVYVFTDRPPRPPPTGVSACTAGLLCRRCWASTSSPTGLPSSPPTGVSACTAGLLCHRCWASTSSPTGRLVSRRLVFLPARLAYYATVVGRLRLHRPAASSAADWCFRLHGWPIMPPLLGVYVFTDRLAFAAADWCVRLHGWPIMPPLLGVYVFTDRLAFAAADWCFRLHGWPLCRRCWASTSSPTGSPRPPPTGVSACTAGLYAAVVGRLRRHRPACLRRRRLVFPPARLAFMPPLLGVYVFTDRPPRPPPTGASACTADLLCRRCWASTSSPTGRLDRRRLVFPPARLAYYAAVVGRLRLHRPAAASAADWCHRLHGWPVITPTDAIFFTAGYIAVTTNRHQYLQHKLPTFAMAADWFLHFHGCMILPVLIGLIFFTAGRLVCC